MTLRLDAKLQADRQQPTTDRAGLVPILLEVAEQYDALAATARDWGKQAPEYAEIYARRAADEDRIANRLREAAVELSKPVPDAADTKAARELADKIETRNVSSNVDRIRDSNLLLDAGPMIDAQADTIDRLNAGTALTAEGFAVVPMEPTEKMILAAIRMAQSRDGRAGRPTGYGAADTYRAMIRAASIAASGEGK